MEAKDQLPKAVAPSVENPLACAECLQLFASTVLSRSGDILCTECASIYYVSCGTCNGLVPRDEAQERETALYCEECYPKTNSDSDVPQLEDGEVELLVSEYITLHAEEKRITARLNEIKEQLKLAAAARSRIANAVTLRAESGAVKCSYSVRINCDTEKTAALESQLEPDSFAALFESKVTFKARREELEAFLSKSDPQSQAARDAVRACIELVETPTLTVIQQKKKR